MDSTPRKPERTPRGQGKLLRERLIKTALTMIDQGKSSALSIRSVTKLAGVSPTAFYLHFENRDELIYACLEVCFAQFRDQLREAAAGSDDPREQLLEAGLAYIEFARVHQERYALIFGTDSIAPSHSDSTHHKSAPASDALEDLVALVRGYLGKSNPHRDEAEVLAKGIWSGLHGFVTLRRARPGVGWPDEKEFTRRLASAWLGEPA